MLITVVLYAVFDEHTVNVLSVDCSLTRHDCDVYRRVIEPTRSAGVYIAYITFTAYKEPDFTV